MCVKAAGQEGMMGHVVFVARLNVSHSRTKR